MAKTADITTAANSKTLNAVEKERLYAAAGAVDPELNRSELNKEEPNNGNGSKKVNAGTGKTDVSPA